jgi:nucleoid-associated protein YgaU
VTRELKLALIVGFALVLVVTVLVSDHLSRARKAQLAPPASDPSRLAVTPDAPIKPDAEPPVRMLPATGEALPVPPEREPMIARSATPAVPAPVSISQGTAPQPEDNRLAIKQGDPDFELLQTLRQKGLDIVMRGGERVIVPLVETRSEPIPGGANRDEPADAAAKLRETLRDSLRETGAKDSGAAGGGDKPEIRNANNSPRTPSPAPTTPTAGERSHNVASGESLAAISKRYYGSESHWRRLAAFNKLPDNGAVRQGARLRIPTVEVLTGRGAQPTVQPSSRPAPLRVEDAGRDTRTASAKPDVKPEAKPTTKTETRPKPDRPREYVVARGDTLGSIAQRLLGSSRRAEELVALNKLDDEDSVVIGTRLRLPSN